MRTQSAASVVARLKKLSSAKNRAGMARFGINVENALGVSVYDLRPLAKEIGKNHALALGLWNTGVHEARLLAGFVGDPEKVTEKQFERWAADFDSWDVCDQVCSNLFDRTRFAWKKAAELAGRKGEFVKRTGFVLMACLAVHDKRAKDADFEKFFPLIRRHATDPRNFVRKAVNWALRNIGKRNLALNRKALAVAREIRKIDDKTARWIAADAIRELESGAVRKRLKLKARK